MFVFKFLDINMLFSKEFKLLDEKSAYVKVLKLKDIIIRSFGDQESFSNLSCSLISIMKTVKNYSAAVIKLGPY